MIVQMKKLTVAILLSCMLAVAGCGPLTSEEAPEFTGGFTFLSVNILEGQIWEINRPIQLQFNHPIDFRSVSFQSVSMRAVGQSSALPVTGQFSIDENDPSILVFNPACPTNSTQDNGAFLPGNVTYVLGVPQSDKTISVLRDTDGRPLSSGLLRTFSTPPIAQPFMDLVPGAPKILDSDNDISFPSGVNFWADNNDAISVRFNQSIDARAENLNIENLKVLYSNDEIGAPGADVYDDQNKVPGEWVLIENCSENGSLVEFRVTGVLPINRNLIVEMTAEFSDIVGQTNFTSQIIATHQVPSLSDVYDTNLGGWLEANETVDEFSDNYYDQNFLDLDEPLPVPLANIGDGFISAGFDYPGVFVSDDKDFYINSSAPRDLYTDSQLNFSDSNGRVHVVNSGVLNVHDFTIDAGATLRGRGTNPLIIYATGTVTINGVLNVSGNNAVWPSGLNSPQFIEGGGLGECGGGQGGDASQVGDAETLRAEAGDGPFGIEFAGGKGGEGIFNGPVTNTGVMGQNARSAAGGGGGGFALTENQAVLWTHWKTGGSWSPSYFHYSGPDHVTTGTNGHTMAVGSNGIFGAEPGIRGVSASTTLPSTGTEPHGMEDGLIDSLVSESLTSVNSADYDPTWNFGESPPFEFGHPTEGADPGAGGQAIFINDNDLLDDFYGTRLMEDGTVKQGELLVPWAGSGGGGSGDSMMINTYDADGDGFDDPFEELYPVVPFGRNQGGNGPGWYNYQKGAGGGGGGGQLIIMSIGLIVIGNDAEIQANGGVGFSGESLIYTDAGVSGSGGGSGGHIVLHSSTGLDLSAVNIGNSSSASTVGNLTENGVIQAFGGRRGQCGGVWTTANPDGSATYAFGRGGAGANGVVQIHVPDPKEDIFWHISAATGIADYLDEVPIATDRVEEILGNVSFPQAYSLIPFYSSSSMVTSEWIDTGLAELRLRTPNDYPVWASPDPELLVFQGIRTSDGKVNRQGGQEKVRQLNPIVVGAVADVTFGFSEMVIPNASTFFAGNQEKFLRLPQLLLGYDIRPNAVSETSFEIVDVNYDGAIDEMTLYTNNADGSVSFSVDPTGDWSIVPKFFRIDTNGAKNAIPLSSDIYFEFQGADEISPGANLPGTPVLGDNVWTSNLSQLDGARFLRYRISFEADSQGSGITLSTPLPVLSYVKLPYVF